VPVFGAELRTHFNAADDLIVVNGTFIPGINVNPKPTRSPEDAGRAALARVLADLGKMPRNLSVQPTLMVYRMNLAKGEPGSNHLVWQVEVGNRVDVRDFVYVDAHSGKVIDKIAGIHDAKNRRAFNGANATAPGPNYPNNPFWVEGSPFPTGTTEADNMIAASSDVYDFFRNAFGRDSYNGAGARMDSIFNRGNACPNASWNGTFISFCPGLTTDDVTAHEWAHAYTEYTHRLIYAWQPGALNESYSDIWGETIDRINGRGGDTPDTLRTGACNDPSVRWLLGEDSTAPGLTGAFRDMYNPTCKSDPGKVTDTQYTCSASDSGGVHKNSGVPNHAYALTVDGGTYNGQVITGIGLTKAAHIYFRAQSVYQGPASNFADHADALTQSCTDLTGANLIGLTTGTPSGEIISSTDCQQLAKAVLAVQLRTPPTQCNFQPLLAQSPPALCAAGTVSTLASDAFDGGKRDGIKWQVSNIGNTAAFVPRNWGVVRGLPSGRPGLGMYGSDPDIGSCTAADDQSGLMRLESGPITIPANTLSLRMAFDHWVATEAGYDGGNVKISVNGGAWQLVTAANFIYNAYNRTMITAAGGNSSPLAGQPGFSGADGGAVTGTWGRSIINLAPYAVAGDNIRLRFELGSDICTGAFGWYLDDVKVYSCQPTPAR